MDKKSISAVVATALLLVITVIAVSGFQIWFNSYSSSTFIDVKEKSSTSIMDTQINSIFNDNLYFNNNLNKNISIFSIKINGRDCNITKNITVGLESINLNNCTKNLTKNLNEVTIISDLGIFRKTIYIKDSEISNSNSEILTPTLSLVSNISILDYNYITKYLFSQDINLSWISTNSITCEASGDWSGVKSITNSEIISDIIDNSSYILNCSNSEGNIINTVNITVNPISIFTETFTGADGSSPNSDLWSLSGTSTVSPQIKNNEVTINVTTDSYSRVSQTFNFVDNFDFQIDFHEISWGNGGGTWTRKLSIECTTSPWIGGISLYMRSTSSNPTTYKMLLIYDTAYSVISTGGITDSVQLGTFRLSRVNDIFTAYYNGAQIHQYDWTGASSSINCKFQGYYTGTAYADKITFDNYQINYAENIS